MFALVDCNNFFVSCERVFNPQLRNVPVAVLSSNDGCVIARSNEVKALGVPMGAPYFKYKALLRQHGARVFSSNFELVGDMSDRVMQTLRPFVEEMEIYSVDEAFVRLPTLPNESYAQYGKRIRETIYRHTGIPVSVGIAPTKTLTKIAGVLIKQTPTKTGVLDIAQVPDVDARLAELSVHKVWGIGSALTRRLEGLNIHTVRDYKYADERLVKKHLHTPGLRTLLELKGVSCLPLAAADEPCKTVLHSRTFSRTVREFADLRGAISTFAAKAGEKLRQKGRIANLLTVFVQTSRFKEACYANRKTIALPRATAYSPDLLAAAERGLQQIFLPGHEYKRAGILLTELEADNGLQPDLFAEMDVQQLEKRARMMGALDAINKKFGRDTTRFLAEGATRWQMRRQMKSPAYTTKLAEIPVVKC